VRKQAGRFRPARRVGAVGRAGSIHERALTVVDDVVQGVAATR
jgi:hypothetical protein